MPKVKNSLTPEQLRYMEAAQNALNQYAAFVHDNNVYYQSGTDYEVEEAIRAQIASAESMAKPQEYEAWLQAQEEVSRKLQEVLQGIQNYITSDYKSSVSKDEKRPMEEVLDGILAKNKDGKPLSPEEENLAIVDDYKRFKSFRAETEKLTGILAAVPQVRNAQAQEEAAPQNKPVNPLADGLAAFAAELKRLESWGHHDQWKDMKEALTQARTLSEHLPEDPEEARTRMLEAMTRLQETSMAYVVYKAAKNPRGKDLQRQQMAERMMNFSVQQMIALTPVPEAAQNPLQQEINAGPQPIAQPQAAEPQPVQNAGEAQQPDAVPEAVREERRKEFRARIDRARMDLGNPLSPYIKENLYIVYAGALYERALRNGGKTPEEKEIIRSVEELGLYDAGQEGSLAKKLIDADEKDPDGLLHKWFSSNNENVIMAMRSEERVDEVCDAITAGHDPEQWIMYRYEKMSAEELAFDDLLIAVDKERIKFSHRMFEATEDRFDREADRNIQVCYRLAMPALYEGARERKAKGVDSAEDRKIMTAVERGKAFEYADNMMEWEQECHDGLLNDWFGPHNISYQTAQAMSSMKTAKPILEKLKKGISPELTPEKRADNAKNYLYRAEKKRSAMKKSLIEMTDGARDVYDVKEEDYYSESYTVIDSCYRTYVGALYSRAAQRAKEGTANEQDRAVIEAVESGKGNSYVDQLIKEDEKNPDSITAKWFGSGQVTLATARDMTEGIRSDRLQEILDAIGKGMTPEQEHLERIRSGFRQAAEDARNSIQKNGAENFSLDTAKNCYTIYSYFLYEQALKNGGKTKEEQEVLSSAESGKFDVKETDSYACRLWFSDKNDPNSITARWFREEFIPQTVKAMSDPKTCMELCGKIAAGMTPEQVFPEYVPAPVKKSNIAAFRKSVEDARNVLNQELRQENKDLAACLKEAREKGKDLTEQIFTAFAGDLYERMTKYGTPEADFITSQVERGKGKELVALLREDVKLSNRLEFQAIQENTLQAALTAGGFKDMVKQAGIPTIVRFEMAQARADKDLSSARFHMPAAEKAGHISDLAYFIYAGMRYTTAKGLKSPTEGSKAIVRAVEKAGLQAYADALKEDPNTQKLFDPKNLKPRTIDKLYTGPGRKEFTSDITAGEPAPQKKGTKPNPEPVKDGGMAMGK